VTCIHYRLSPHNRTALAKKTRLLAILDNAGAP
jgi:hypothetical protein